jgi:hypothetical protein
MRPETKLAGKPCTCKTDQAATRYRHHFDSPMSGGHITVIALIPKVIKRISQLTPQTLFGVNVIDCTYAHSSVHTCVCINLIALTNLGDTVHTEFN